LSSSVCNGEIQEQLPRGGATPLSGAKVTIAKDAVTITDKFDFYVDKVKKRSGNLRTVVDAIDIFNVASGSSPTTDTYGDLWVDYLKIYQGEPSFLPVDSEE
jgi:hypothetical protein